MSFAIRRKTVSIASFLFSNNSILKIMKIFGIRVKQELKEQGKLQKDLCEYLKINPRFRNG